MRNERETTITVENNTNERDYLIPVPSDISAPSAVHRKSVHEVTTKDVVCNVVVCLSSFACVSIAIISPSEYPSMRALAMSNLIALSLYSGFTGSYAGFWSARANNVQDQPTQTLENAA